MPQSSHAHGGVQLPPLPQAHREAQPPTRALSGTQPVSTPALSEGLLLPAEKEVRQEAARMMQEVIKTVEEINKR